MGLGVGVDVCYPYEKRESMWSGVFIRSADRLASLIPLSVTLTLAEITKSAKTKPVRLIFSLTCQLIRIKFDVVLKRFGKNITTLL